MIASADFVENVLLNAERDEGRPIVRFERVSMQYETGAPALNEISLTLYDREFLAVVGPSGCGKSTLLKLISGLLKPSVGRVLLNGDVIRGIPDGIGFMFQRDALLPWRTVQENLEVALDCRGVPKGDRTTKIAELLSLLGLSEFRRAYPHALSGGMRQRVALGRLLAYEASIMLMDEPFGALDALTKAKLGQELLDIWQRSERTIVFVTHDIEEAVALSDRVVVMSGRPGRVTSEYKTSWKRPRDIRALRRTSEFQDVCYKIWNDLEDVTNLASGR